MLARRGETSPLSGTMGLRHCILLLFIMASLVDAQQPWHSGATKHTFGDNSRMSQGLPHDFDSMTRFDMNRKATRVHQVASGFFIGGSSIKEMNGVYRRVKWVNDAVEHEVMGAYRKFDYDKQDDGTGWVLAYIKAPKPKSGITPVNPHPHFTSEWVIIDPQHKDRFGHDGETRAPLSGKHWKHLHRRTSRQSTGTNELQAADDPAELPQQVVYIAEADRVESLRRGHLEHRMKSEDAMGGAWDTTVRGGSGGSAEDKNGGIEGVPDAEMAFAEGRFGDVAAIFSKEITNGCGEACDKGGVDEYWWAAVMKVRLAEALRRNKEYERAVDEAAGALGIYPTYAKAWLQIGMALLDSGHPQHAIGAFTKLHEIDAGYPDLAKLLVTSYAATERSVRSNGGAGDEALVAAAERMGLSVLPRMTPGVGVQWNGHYQTLGLPVIDATHDEITAAAERLKASSASDPATLASITGACDILCDPGRRTMYDDGDDLDRRVLEDGGLDPAVKDKVLRTYFPQRFEFEPYGSPWESSQDTPQADIPAPKSLLP